MAETCDLPPSTHCPTRETWWMPCVSCWSWVGMVRRNALFFCLQQKKLCLLFAALRSCEMLTMFVKFLLLSLWLHVAVLSKCGWRSLQVPEFGCAELWRRHCYIGCDNFFFVLIPLSYSAFPIRHVKHNFLYENMLSLPVELHCLVASFLCVFSFYWYGWKPVFAFVLISCGRSNSAWLLAVLYLNNTCPF